jgi:hypothetical protein
LQPGQLSQSPALHSEGQAIAFVGAFELLNAEDAASQKSCAWRSSVARLVWL